MNSETTTYTERSPWPGFVSAIYWGAIVLASYPLLAGWDTELPFATRFLIVGGIFGIATALRAVLGGLTVHIQETRLWIHLGSVSLIKKVVPFSEIEALDQLDRYIRAVDSGLLPEEEARLAEDGFKKLVRGS